MAYILANMLHTFHSHAASTRAFDGMDESESHPTAESYNIVPIASPKGNVLGTYTLKTNNSGKPSHPKHRRPLQALETEITNLE